MKFKKVQSDVREVLQKLMSIETSVDETGKEVKQIQDEMLKSQIQKLNDQANSILENPDLNQCIDESNKNEEQKTKNETDEAQKQVSNEQSADTYSYFSKNQNANQSGIIQLLSSKLLSQILQAGDLFGKPEVSY